MEFVIKQIITNPSCDRVLFDSPISGASGKIVCHPQLCLGPFFQTPLHPSSQIVSPVTFMISYNLYTIWPLSSLYLHTYSITQDVTNHVITLLHQHDSTLLICISRVKAHLSELGCKNCHVISNEVAFPVKKLHVCVSSEVAPFFL